MSPPPWSADYGLAATDSRLRSVDIRHLSEAHGLLSTDSRPAAADNRRMSSASARCASTTDECPRTSP